MYFFIALDTGLSIPLVLIVGSSCWGTFKLITTSAKKVIQRFKYLFVFLIWFHRVHKNYFILIHSFICKKWLHSFPKIFVSSDAFEVKIIKVIYFCLSYQRRKPVYLCIVGSLISFTSILNKFIFQSCLFHNCLKDTLKVFDDFRNRQHKCMK